MEKNEIKISFIAGMCVFMYLIFALFFVFIINGSMESLVVGLFVGELFIGVKERVKNNTRATNILHVISFVLLAITSFGIFGQASEAIFFLFLVGYVCVVASSCIQDYSAQIGKKGEKEL